MAHPRPGRCSLASLRILARRCSLAQGAIELVAQESIERVALVGPRQGIELMGSQERIELGSTGASSTGAAQGSGTSSSRAPGTV